MIKIEAADNPNTPGRLLKKLATDKDDRVRLYLALNPNTPGRLLKKLANDANDWVKKEASKKLK